MLEVRGVSKTYKGGGGKVHAVRSVDMSIAAGERVFIHGPSGAGKSTLLHILGGLSRPTSGSVIFKDNVVYSLNDPKRSRLRNKSFGFIFQFYHLLPELTILENVVLPGRINGGESLSLVRSRAKGLLDAVGMAGRLHHKPSQISGGEAQRTAIARALINSPDVLFCDEPAGNLDSARSEEIYALIREISERNKMGVVLISHQIVKDDFFDTEYEMVDGVLTKYESAKVSECQSIKA
jgi:lipoprotein-releasing system ATP-binding protein